MFVPSLSVLPYIEETWEKKFRKEYKKRTNVIKIGQNRMMRGKLKVKMKDAVTV
jgi:hypothetical protein